MGKVLIVYPSPLGATGETAREVMEELTARGLQVDLRRTSEISELTDYDAVVLGSAGHLRHWEKEAMQFLASHAADLAGRPTWLFQTGPYGRLGEDQHAEPPQAVVARCAEIGAEPPKVFTGNLSGPVRNCDEVRIWSGRIADRVLAGLVAHA
jgi:menaquinone-dependent protoporphyrinogen oxidase